MPIHDIRSKLLPKLVYSKAFASDPAPIESTISVDNINQDEGGVFIISVTNWQDGQISSITMQETDVDPNVAILSDYTAVETQRVLGNISGITSTNSIGADTLGGVINSVGYFSTKRYVRLVFDVAPLPAAFQLNVYHISMTNFMKDGTIKP